MSFIDRNPEQMMQYAKAANPLIEEMQTLVKKVDGLLNAYAADLDAPTQKQLQVLKTLCDKFDRQIEAYQLISEEVYTKATKLASIRNGG